MHGLFRWSGKWWPGVIPLVIFWAIAAWTSTEPLEADLAQRSTAALKDTVLDKTADRGRRPRRDACGGGLLGRWPAERGGVGRGGAGRAAGQRRNPPRSRSQAVRLVGRARRRPGDAVGQFAAAGEQGPADGGGARRSRRRRGGRPDESGARRAAALRQCRAAAARPDRQAEGRQDHAVGHQGQPVRHGARTRRPRSDRRRAEKSARGLFGRRQRRQGAALHLPGLQGSGRGDADADRLCARQQRPRRAGGGGGTQVLQREGRRQSQGERRRARGICQRRGAGARRAVAAVDRHARGLRPRGEAVGRCAL